MVQTIVFIGTNRSGSSREAIRTADRMGYLTVLLTNRYTFLQQRTAFPDVYEMIYSNLRKENVISCLKKMNNRNEKIAAILSFMDSYVYLASELSDEWGISSFSTEAIRLMENKIYTREVLKHSFSPGFDVFYPKDSFKHFLKRQSEKNNLIVKLPESTGSKDVMLADNESSLKYNINKLSKLHRNQPILVEERLDGPQYLVEVLVDKGVVHIIAVVKQYFSKVSPFVVTGYSIVQEHQGDFYQKLYDDVSSIIHAFNMRKGACHLELRFVEGEWKLIEVNPRISGGAMNAMVEEAFGINLAEQTIRLRLGQTPHLTRQYTKHVFTHYLTVHKTGQLLKVTGREEAENQAGVTQVYIKPRKGMIMRPPIAMGNRYGYVMATGETEKEAKQTAQIAAKKIKFHIEPL